MNRVGLDSAENKYVRVYNKKKLSFNKQLFILFSWKISSKEVFPRMYSQPISAYTMLLNKFFNIHSLRSLHQRSIYFFLKGTVSRYFSTLIFGLKNQGLASVLFKRMFGSLRSFPFFIKERSDLCFLFRSLLKNGTFFLVS